MIASRAKDAAPRGPLFWTGAAAGGAIMGIGVAGALGDSVFTDPPALAAWIVGCALVHDGLVAPVVAVVGALLGRISAPGRALVQAGLIVSAVVSLVAIPLVGRFGERPDDPSALPGNYGAGLALVLVATWVTILGVAAGRIARRRASSRPRSRR